MKEDSKTYFIEKFNFEEDKVNWNTFIKTNSEGHFFFQTDYLFYHKERFDDFSLLIYDNTKNLICVLPACFEIVESKKIYSHKGLTFGGFVFKDDLNFLEKREIVFSCFVFLKRNNFDSLIIKSLPSYFQFDSNREESIHRLLNNNFENNKSNKLDSKILRVEANLLVRFPKTDFDYQESTYKNYSKRKKRNLHTAYKSNLRLMKTEFSTDFWEIIEENLKTKHNLVPVHSAAEIQLLHDKFPQNIHFSIVKKYNKNSTTNSSEIVACSVIFIYQSTIHLQYMAATKQGKKINALDFMIDELVQNYSVYFDDMNRNSNAALTYLSLGVSELRNNDNKSENEDSINKGLFKWKEEFGAKTFSHFVYQIKL